MKALCLYKNSEFKKQIKFLTDIYSAFIMYIQPQILYNTKTCLNIIGLKKNKNSSLCGNWQKKTVPN